MSDDPRIDPCPEITLLAKDAKHVGYVVEHDGGGSLCIFRRVGNRLLGVLVDASGVAHDLASDTKVTTVPAMRSLLALHAVSV